jgi:uncharacterized protein YeaO (DUF488 family)
MAIRKPNIDVARVYDAPKPDGRCRVLVDRLWPRGVKKEDLQLDLWAKDLAPSDQLRKWFQHDPQRWDRFRERYFAELDRKSAEVAELLDSAGKRSLLLLYGARDQGHNNAVALQQYLERKVRRARRSRTAKKRS